MPTDSSSSTTTVPDESSSTTTAGDGLMDSFVIRRPLPEGTALSVDTPGFSDFEDVRGDSGTKVVLHLSNKPAAQQLLDESVLQAMLLKLLETTQYTVAFSSSDQVQAIIDASAQEAQMMRIQQEASSSLKQQMMEPSLLDDPTTRTLHYVTTLLKDRALLLEHHALTTCLLSWCCFFF
jgi:hypothetical protein